MKAVYINIVLVCLDGDFNKDICKGLADKLDMFFANLKDYIEYYSPKRFKTGQILESIR